MSQPTRNPITRTVRKVGVGALGATTVAVGVVLIPLPGPGTLIVLGGLGILGSEFPAARRLSGRIKGAARDAVTRVRRPDAPRGGPQDRPSIDAPDGV